MAHRILLPASHGRRYVVEPGILDSRALLAFNMGQCHSMALALHRATGGEMLGLLQHQPPFDHILVRADDGRLLDVGGARQVDDVTTDGRRLHGVDTATIAALTTEFGWVPAQPEVAAHWAPQILDRAARKHPHLSPPCFTRDFSLDERLDVHIEWSIVDTGERLTAFGRGPSATGGRWVRCGVMSIKENERGERIIDFTEQAFEAHASLFRAVREASADLVVGRASEGAEPQQPLRPPL